MEVITIDSKAFQQLVEKVNLIADYVHKARLEQSTNSDEEWVDSQVVCQYFRSTHSDNRKIIAFFVRFAEKLSEEILRAERALGLIPKTAAIRSRHYRSPQIFHPQPYPISYI